MGQTRRELVKSASVAAASMSISAPLRAQSLTRGEPVSPKNSAISDSAVGGTCELVRPALDSAKVVGAHDVGGSRGSAVSSVIVSDVPPDAPSRGASRCASLFSIESEDGVELALSALDGDVAEQRRRERSFVLGVGQQDGDRDEDHRGTAVARPRSRRSPRSRGVDSRVLERWRAVSEDERERAGRGEETRALPGPGGVAAGRAGPVRGSVAGDGRNGVVRRGERGGESGRRRRTTRYAGLTVDRTPLDERWKGTRAVKKLRCNASSVFMLDNLDAVGRAEREIVSEWSAPGAPIAAPPMKCRNFNFTISSDAI